MSLLSVIGRLFDGIVVVFAWLAGLLLLFAMTIVCVDVVMRYFFNSPTGWVLQFCEYILLYVPFMAAAYVLREGSHIKIDILLNRLNRRTQSLTNLVTSVMGFGVLAILTYYGAYITIDFYQRNVPTIKHLKIPEYTVIMIIPIGCFLFSIQFIRRAYKYYKKQKEEGPG